MPRRWLIVAAMLLIAGTLTNAVVAWFLLWRAHTEAPGQTWYGGQFTEWLRTDSGEWLRTDSGEQVYWQIGFTPGRGVLYLGSYYGKPRYEGYRAMSESKEYVLSHVPGWAVQHLIERDSIGTPGPRKDVEDREIHAAGYPLQSFYAIVDGDIFNDNLEVHGGFAIKHYSELFMDSVYFVVPYRPILTGFIVNTLIWSFVWAIPVAAFVGGRRLWRHERGRCPRCAYDLRHQLIHGCSECGWRRSNR